LKKQFTKEKSSQKTLFAFMMFSNITMILFFQLLIEMKVIYLLK